MIRSIHKITRPLANQFGKALSGAQPLMRSPVQINFLASTHTQRHFSSLNELLVEEVTHEMTKGDEIDQEFEDSKKHIESLFSIADEAGTGWLF